MKQYTIGKMIGIVEHTFGTTSGVDNVKRTCTVKFDYRATDDDTIKLKLARIDAIDVAKPMRKLSGSDMFKTYNGATVLSHLVSEPIKTIDDQTAEFTALDGFDDETARFAAENPAILAELARKHLAAQRQNDDE